MAISIETLVTTHSPDYLQFPGQGTQHVGMIDKIYDNFPRTRARFDQADAFLGYPLKLMTQSETMLARTRFTQPAIVETSVITLEEMEAQGIVDASSVAMVVGHSVGLYAALIKVGSTSFEEGMRLVDARAVGMQHASDLHPGSMDSVFGLSEAEAQEVCAKIPDLYVAVINDPNSVVVGGTYAALERGRQEYKKMKGIKPRRLEVDGAFHTPLMEPAVEIFTNQLANTTVRNPEKLLLANTSARLLETGRDIKDELPAQLTEPVRWIDVEEELHARDYTHAIEPSEAAILSNIRKRRRGGTLVTLGVAGAAGSLVTLGTGWILHEISHHDKK